MAIKCPTCHSDNPESLKFCGECGTKLDASGPSHPPSSSDRASFTKTLDRPPDELSRGTLFAGRYEIIEELGAGGMGKVYRAFDKKIEEEIALKLIRPEIAAEKRTVERFRNEIKTARKITHKNVCRTHDLGEDSKSLFLTMEYVRGEDLKSLIRRTRILAASTAVSIGRQVAEGLGEAHRIGVVHRDLKPGNIMIDKEGNAKIMDFGIARLLARPGTTAEGAIIGTPEYMSPEQVEGKPADQRADIYALGVILFEMVTGRPVFEGETSLAVAHKHKYEPVSDPRTLNPNVPDNLATLILHCLEKEKENRYQTAVELRTELEKIQKQIPSTDRITPTKRPITSKEITVKITLRKVFITTLVFGFVIIAAFFSWRFLFNKPSAAVPKIDNSIAVISLRNQTGDAAYDFLCQRSIPDLLITKLENSGSFYVATWERMLDLLKQMGKKEVQSIDSELGFEICQREGIKFIALGSLNKAGEIFVADVKILDAETKGSLKSFQSRGRGEDSILTTQIDQLGSDICTGLGMGGDRAQASLPRIADITTSSFEAYNHYLRGVDLYYQYQYPDARIELEKAVQIDPSFASAYRRLARVLGWFGEQEATEKALESARLFSDRATEKEKLYIEIEIARMNGEEEKSIPALRDLIKKYPKEREAHEWLGGILMNIGDLDGSKKEFQQILEIDPYFAEAYNLLAILNTMLGNFEEALNMGKKYGSLMPDRGNPFDTIAYVYFYWGKLDEAIANEKIAIEKDPDLYGSYYSLIYMYALREDYPAAMEWTNRLLSRVRPPAVQADTSVLKGFLELWLGRTKRSLMDFERAESLFRSVGNEIGAWFASYCKAIAYCDEGNYELSQRLHNSAFDYYVSISGGQRALTRAELDYNLAWNDLMIGRLGSAKAKEKEMRVDFPKISERGGGIRYWSNEGLRNKIEYLHDLLEQEIAIRDEGADIGIIFKSSKEEPDYLKYFTNTWFVTQIVDFVNFPPPFIKDILPRAYIQKGDLEKALAAYEHLVTLYPQRYDKRLIHPLIHYRLAKLYEQTGHRNKAIARYKKFLGLWKDADPGRPEVDDARKRLADLSRS